MFNGLKILNFKSCIYSYLISITLIFSCPQYLFADSSANVWDVLRSEFSLNHEPSQPEVKKQIRWLVAHPEYLQRLSKSEPYIYHIVTEIKKRKLPGELALMPMIESAYNPFAFSSAGASGLWQIMPRTGLDFGLKQNWWSDSRRGVNSSTKAALNYLSYLNHFFRGNWLLALAAYDAGEGTTARSIRKIKKSKSTARFWSLPLPRETKAYIPKILALAEVIQHPQKYHVKLPHIDHKPYFKVVDVGSQIDLVHAAKLAGISYQDLIKLNPEYNRWATAPNLPYRLLIPIKKVDIFKKNLANIPKDKRITWSRHKIIAGDNLQTVAKKYNTKVSLIKNLNQLKTSSIKNEQYILVPKQNSVDIKQADKTVVAQRTPHFSVPKQYKVVHIVSDKDSYSSLQTKYNISNEELIKWNEALSSTGKLLPGQSIVIWKQTRKPVKYIVKKGDNLSTIAYENNKQIGYIMQLNPGLRKNRIKIGQSINLS
jgi:membrane-bound lytic murein transglycosylase D